MTVPNDFLYTAHVLDLISEHQDAIVITPKAVFFANGEKSDIITISDTLYHELKHTIKYVAAR